MGLLILSDHLDANPFANRNISEGYWEIVWKTHICLETKTPLWYRFKYLYNSCVSRRKTASPQSLKRMGINLIFLIYTVVVSKLSELDTKHDDIYIYYWQCDSSLDG